MFHSICNRDKPPTKGVVVVNLNYVRVKRPVSFKLIFQPSDPTDVHNKDKGKVDSLPNGTFHDGESCSIWFPIAPKGYVALGCVVSAGRTQPPLSSVFCISTSLVSPCSLRDCISINNTNSYVFFYRHNLFLYSFCDLNSNICDSITILLLLKISNLVNVSE